MKTLLKVLCILTFIYSGINFISCAVVAIPGETFWITFFEKFEDELENQEQMEELMAQNPQIREALETAKVFFGNRGYYAFMAFLCACSVVGAAFMYKKRIIGFHIYTLAHLLMIALPLIVFRDMSFSVGGTIFSLIIIGLYALAIFKNKKPAINSNDNDYTY
jgi:hypothetical protein